MKIIKEIMYAKRCLRIGVCEYFLKSVVREEVKKSLNKILLEFSSEDINISNDEYFNRNNNTIENIKIYIENNYEKYDMNLNFISQLFNFNTNYLSRLFKKET